MTDPMHKVIRQVLPTEEEELAHEKAKSFFGGVLELIVGKGSHTTQYSSSFKEWDTNGDEISPMRARIQSDEEGWIRL